MDSLPHNFHKAHFPIDIQNYCLGDEKLTFILNEMKSNGDLKKDSILLLPFGGPGSAANFFDYNNVKTVSGDIEYGKKYNFPEKQLSDFRKKYNYVGVEQKFIIWDVMNLPVIEDKFQLALVNPPYGIRCKIEKDALKLAIESFFKIVPIMDRKSIIYYTIPEYWVDEFLLQTKIEPKYIYTKKRLSSDPNSCLPLSLLRIEIEQKLFKGF